MTDDGTKQRKTTRRGILTHIGSLLAGGVIGLFSDPFRRWVIGVLPNSLSRRASLKVGYDEFQAKTGTRKYTVLVANGGREVAENVAVRVGFPEEITDYRVKTGALFPPHPEFNVSVNDDGTASIRIDHLPPYRVGAEFMRLQFVFTVNENSEAEFEIPNSSEFGEGILVTYRYSWTYLGERFYENSDHHFSSIDT